MAQYSIITTDGGELATGVAEHDVARRAQEIANERGEAVTYYATPVPTDEDGEGLDDGVTVEPEGVAREGAWNVWQWQRSTGVDDLVCVGSYETRDEALSVARASIAQGETESGDWQIQRGLDGEVVNV